MQPGTPEPLGATLREDGVNFALFSQHAKSVTLCLLDPETKKIVNEYPLDSKINRKGAIWHIFLPDLPLPLLYMYRVNGPHEQPHFYHPKRLLSDPYAKSLKTKQQWGQYREEKYLPYALLEKKEPFDWQGIASPQLKMQDLIIYEMHVRNFSAHPSSKVEKPGTYSAIIEKIPYFKDLGINAVELMPIQEFNECGYTRSNPQSGQRLYNCWGYSTINFFSPMNRYAVQDSLTEFKTLVRELHRNGIEIFLDIVLNHTGEKNDQLYSFMGIDHSVYYMLKDGHHCNYTGCGHTMNLSHPVMRRFVKDCLSYWVTEMHIDGFRFDLASIMNRDKNGKLLQPSALIEEISENPVLRDTKLIAEPWDIDAYQLGGFYPEKNRWSEWNGKYRDTVRSFIKGDAHVKSSFATCLAGSADYFHTRAPYASINFITAHDGFSLADLVSYNEKHNEANGENNRDGLTNNFSWNCGAEGPTDNPEILRLREKQKKNFILTLLLSQGVPMILMGDEVDHSKQGNNNTWCQDNEISWLNWEKKGPYYDFVRKMIQFRKERSILRRDTFLKENELIWHGSLPYESDWNSDKSFLAFSIINTPNPIYAAFNATTDHTDLTLPGLNEGKKWHLIVNTDADAPNDFVEKGVLLEADQYSLPPYSSILLEAR